MAEYLESLMLMTASVIVAVAGVGLAGTGLLIGAQCQKNQPGGGR